jgi:hypothetical protein
MNETVNIDGLADAIIKNLQEYTDDVTDGIKKDVDIVSKEVNDTIKSHITFKQHTGKYVKSFRIKKTYEDRYKKVNTWYVKAPEYRLTHLLEDGHATRNGGRTKAYPHIKYGEEIAEQRMMELSEETIRNAGH